MILAIQGLLLEIANISITNPAGTAVHLQSRRYFVLTYRACPACTAKYLHASTVSFEQGREELSFREYIMWIAPIVYMLFYG